MFIFAFFIGVYSYCIFALGMFDILTRLNIISVTVIWFILLVYFEREFLVFLFKKVNKQRFSLKKVSKDAAFPFILLFILLALVNLIGVLGPELAFDSLWYHLTLPKLYLLHHSLYHIPGGLLYYSDMPKLGEMLYVSALSFGNEILAKLIHYSFGILVSIALYKVSRKFFNQTISLLAVIIFYSNLVVDWESITAYIDLMRTFFEILTLWGFINWYESRGIKWIAIVGIMTGFAITTKVLSMGSLIIFSLLLLFIFMDSRKHGNKKIKLKIFIIMLTVYWIISLGVPLPWFIFSFIHTGNPFYPFFTPYFSGVQNNVFSLILLNPLHFFITIWNILTRASDPISPIYIILLPFVIAYIKRMTLLMKYISIYVLLSFCFWYMTSSIEGSRLLVPYLPGFTLLCGFVIDQFRKQNYKVLYRIIVLVIIIISAISIFYRLGANAKYVPVILGNESQSQFLTTHLNFSFGDFYDTDNYFATHIKPTDVVLLYGFHNLYYVDFPYIDNSWVQKGYKFNYIAVQNTKIPSKYANWQLIYFNDKTKVRLYRNNSAHFSTYQ